MSLDFIPTDTLALIWFLVIGFMIALYILFDGGDLGIGILSLFPQKETERSLMMHIMGPLWGANETWLIVAAGMLFGAFPTAYGIILSALYIPIMCMLFGLILRATSFEFHAFATRKRVWSFMFGFGSLLAALGQGAAIGGLLSGIRVVEGQFGGTAFDFLTPLTLLITAGVLMSYVFVGYAYLVKKTGAETAPGTYLRILIVGAATGIILLGATLLLPSRSYLFFTRWTMYPSNYLLFAITGLMGILSLWLIILVFKKHAGPVLHDLCLAIFVLAMLGMLVGVFPYLIPPSMTLYAAASSRQTLLFMLVGLGPLIPIIFAYNYYLHKIFGGRDNQTREEAYGTD